MSKREQIRTALLKAVSHGCLIVSLDMWFNFQHVFDDGLKPVSLEFQHASGIICCGDFVHSILFFTFLFFVELIAGNTEKSLRKAQEVLQRVQSWSNKAVPNKAEVLGNLYSCIGTVWSGFRFLTYILISLPTMVWWTLRGTVSLLCHQGMHWWIWETWKKPWRTILKIWSWLSKGEMFQ